MFWCTPRDVDIKNVIFDVIELDRKTANFMWPAFADVRLVKLPARWRSERIPNGFALQARDVGVYSANRKKIISVVREILVAHRVQFNVLLKLRIHVVAIVKDDFVQARLIYNVEKRLHHD